MSTPTVSVEAVAHVVALRIYCGRLEALQARLEPADGTVPPKWVLDNGVKLLALKVQAMKIAPPVKQRMGVELLVELAAVEMDVSQQWTAAFACVGRMLVKRSR